MSHTVLICKHAKLVFMPLKMLPAMCSPVCVPPFVSSFDRRGSTLARLVHPARLWNAQSMGPFAPLTYKEKRDLRCQRKFLLKIQIWKRAPEYQAAGKRKKMNSAREICFPDGRGECAERTKRQYVFNILE
jgi:hypothetical protein